MLQFRVRGELGRARRAGRDEKGWESKCISFAVDRKAKPRVLSVLDDVLEAKARSLASRSDGNERARLFDSSLLSFTSRDAAITLWVLYRETEELERNGYEALRFWELVASTSLALDSFRLVQPRNRSITPAPDEPL